MSLLCTGVAICEFLYFSASPAPVKTIKLTGPYVEMMILPVFKTSTHRLQLQPDQL